MKLTKKILVAVLAVALLASCFMFSAFADDEAESKYVFNADGITKIDDLLEYYICDDYLADAFEGDSHITSGDIWEYKQDADHTGTSDYYRDFVVEITEDPTDPTNKVLKSELPFNKKNTYEMKDPDKVVLTDKVFLTMDLYFAEDCNEGFELSVKVGYKSNGKTVNSMANLFKFSFKENKIQYTPWDKTTFKGTFADIEGVTPKTNTWYSLTLSFNAEDDIFYFELVEEGGETYKVQFDISAADGVWGFLYEAKYPMISDIKNCATVANPTKTTEYKISEAQHLDNIANYDTFEEGDARRACAEGDCRASEYATYYIDNFEIYEGSFTRFPARKEDITKTTLVDMENIYNAADATREDKFLIAEVLEKLYNGIPDGEGGYTLTPISDTLKNVVANAYKYMNETFANEIILRAAGINSEADYYARVDYIAEEFEYYNGLLGANDEIEGDDGITPEIHSAVIAARAAYETELANLAEIKAHSEGFLSAIANYDPENKVYNDIVDIYNEVNKADYAKRAEEYIGIADAELVFEAIVAKYNRMQKDITDFIVAVNAMQAAEPVAFGQLYTAYLDSLACYTKYKVDAVINPDVDNATVTDFKLSAEDAIGYNLSDVVSAYEDLAPIVVTKRDECNTFNNIVTMASIASYYPSLCEILLDADAALAVITDTEGYRTDELEYRMDYPGISDSYTLYNSLTASLNTIIEASRDYIASVAEIAGATTLAEKLAAIEAAKALKAEGDNLGVEGVKEANLALTAAEAEVNIAIGNSESLIAVVAKIENASTLAERKALILDAQRYVEGATEEYEGVTAAIAALEAAKTSFVADVTALNQALTNASEYVVTIS